MAIKQAITPEVFNIIMQKAFEEMRANPEKGEFAIADDVCRPYLDKLDRDMNSYEELVFHVTKNLAFMFKGVGFHDYE
jgi:hypothetical protein